ncbi:MAG: YjgN family protein [Parvibaculaceae bacterium]
MAFRTFGAQGTGTVAPISIKYIDKPGLGRIALVNAALFVLTLTVYRFWAKTNVRRHIWSCVHINGEPLEYTGRGIELFLGALIVFGLFVLPVFVLVLSLQLWLGPEHPALILVNLGVLLLVLLFWGMALYRARRYQLSRTLWRGIRGALVGSSWSYSLLYFGAWLLRSLTLGWSTPAMNLNLQERMTGDMRIGSMPFRFRGRAGPLYGPYAVCWVTTLVVFLLIAGLSGFAFYEAFGDTLGELFSTEERTGPRTDFDLMGLFLVLGAIIAFLLFGVVYSLTWAFYAARELSIFASYTTIDLARFELDATGGSLIRLMLGNLLLVIFTLGIATPFAQQRLVRYLCDRLSVHGTVNIDEIMQSREAVARTGEGLADAFDVGGI